MPKTNDAFVVEQFHAIAHAVPAVFINILIMSSIFCGFIYREAPSATFLWFVAPLVAVCGARAIYWRNLGRRSHEFSADEMRRLLTTVARLCMALCVAFASVVIYTLPSPELLSQSSIAILVMASAIAISMHLFTLPHAALAVLWSASSSMMFVFLRTGNPVMVGSALALLVVAMALTRLLGQHFDNFYKVVTSRAEIEAMRQDALSMAMTDPLTGLPNRRMFDKRMKECAREGRTFAVAVVDLDGFKAINDLYGHAIGDLFLTEVARRMRSANETNLIARMGGDEFAILIEAVDRVEQAAAVAQSTVARISAPYAFESITGMIGASCGVALWRKPGDENRIVERADIALYQAKDRERGSVIAFSDELDRDVQRRAQIERGLREAIVCDQFEVEFQPVVELASGLVVSFEALARWKHPELGDVPPGLFIPIAEQAGLIETVTDRLLRKAARAATLWPADIGLSFNLSATQLVRPSAALTILGTLAETGLSPQRFEAEVTEIAVMTDVAAATATISALKLAGARVALDDFGAGRSSFSELCELPLDHVKIDKSLVERIAVDERAAGVVGAIVKMCEGLSLACVAEGVETAGQMDVLTRLGCEKAQGYLISRPLTEKAARAFVATHTAGLAPVRAAS